MSREELIGKIFQQKEKINNLQVNMRNFIRTD
jgi:hypothetical protein